MDYVKTQDGTKLYVKIWGTGRPVIMMHGWPLNADSWDDSAMAFAEAGFQAIAYDRRGFGRSSQPWGGYDYDTLADDLKDVMEVVDAKDAALFGFSMGGGEVARYMSRHGGKNVSRAALIASVVPFMLKTADNPHGTDQQVFAEMTAAMKKDRPQFFKGFFKSFFGADLASSSISEEVLDWAQGMTLMAGLKPTLACAAAFATTDFRPDLAAFNVPTLVIHGTADKTVPIDAAGRAAANGIRNSRLIEYDGAPHGLFASHKQRLTEDLLAFLKS